MTHLEKMIEVCEEMEVKHGHTDAMLYLRGYVFGLKHAASMASRSDCGVGIVKPECTPHQAGMNQGRDKP